MKPILQLDSLSIEFDTSIQRINAVDHVSLQINKGEIVGIIGASGSGKSTLAKTILGLQSKNQSNTGQIFWFEDNQNLDLLEQNSEEWQAFRGSRSTIVFQNPLLNLNPSSTVQTHFDRILILKNDHSSAEVITAALTQVGLHTQGNSILSSYPHQLSGGQQQRILIAMALCQEVQLLILDEPMSSLDKANQDAISEILKRLVEEQSLSIMLISHDLNIIGRLSDRIYVLHHGKVIEEGTTIQVLDSPKDAYTKELVAASILDKKPSNKMVNESILMIQDLSHEYRKGNFLTLKKKKICALKNIDITIQKGAILGLVGPSGSGKSTLVKLILGIEELQHGHITLDGVDLSSWSQRDIGKHIQMIPQNTADALNPKMLLDNQLKEVYRVQYGQTEGYEKVIRSLLSDVELDNDKRYRYPSELSGGEIQRMAIVRALIIRPDILVLDESLSALDMLVQKKMINLLLKLNRQLGMTIIMISHDDRLIDGCCDQILYMDQGEMVSM